MQSYEIFGINKDQQLILISNSTRQPPLPSLRPRIAHLVGQAEASRFWLETHDLPDGVLEVDSMAGRASDTSAQAASTSPSTMATTPTSTCLPKGLLLRFLDHSFPDLRLHDF
jgi:hypothetical protein